MIGVADTVETTGATGVPVGWLAGRLDLPSGMPSVPTESLGEAYEDGMVTDGETVTAYANVWNSDDTCNSTLTSCPNVDYEVQVTWEIQCWGEDETLSDTQTVDAPSEYAALLDPSLEGALASVTFTVPGSLCDQGYDADGGVGSVPEFSVSATTTAVSTGGAGTTIEENYEVPGISAAQLTACNCSTNSAAPGPESADAGDPVDTVSGAYAQMVTDASLKAPGYPLVISRSYSSADTAPGPLGPGWSVPWEANLSIAPATGDVTFTAENGDRYVYLPDGTSFYTPPGARSVLAEVTDSSGNVTGYTLTDPAGHTVLTFSSSGALQSEKDASGRGLSFGYNSSGQVASITDAAGHEVTLSYDGSLLSQVALPDSQDVTYGYNSSGQLTSVTDPGNAEWQYTYNPAGLLATVEDPDQNVTVTNTYNSSGQVTQQEDGDQNYTDFSYTTTSGGLAETDVTAPDGGITTYLYGGGMLLEEIGPVDNATTGYSYNIFGEPVIVTDPLGRVTCYGYDGTGDLTSETSDLGYSQYWTYDSSGNVLTYENADNQTTAYTYNSMDEVLTATTPGKEETQYTYNTDGSLATEISARNYTTRYAYFSDGMLESVTNPDNEGSTTYTYDSMGFPLTVTDPMNRTTRYGYDNAERVTSVTTPAGETQYGYDADGNLTSRQDPDLHTWTYKYNADSELVKATDPLQVADTYGYDGDGNQTSFTDGRNITTKTSYYLNDLPETITYSDGTPSVSYTYDADGEVKTVAGGTGTRSLSYNGDGELTADGGFSYGYDNAGNVLSRQYPDGTLTSYGYNTDGQVSSMTVGSAETTYKYDADGNLVSAAAPDGVTESRTYDNADQLTGVSDATSSSTLDSYGLTLNADGQPTAIAVTQDGTAQPARYYGYDSAGRLNSECYSTAGLSACSAASAGTAAGTAASAAAPSGPVTSGETGMCADDASSSTTAGNKIDIYTCNGTGGQTWTAADDGTVQVLGNCLAASGTSSGDAVELEPCTAHDAAGQWRQGAGWELVNPASGLCLTDPSGSAADGTQLQVTTCTGAAYQQWRLPEDTTGYVTDGVTGKCMDDKSSGTAAGTVQDIYSCNGSGAQDWTVDGWSFKVEGLCLEPAGAGTAQNTGLVIETCATSTAQDWAAGPDGWLWNVNAARCASDPSASTTNGTQLIIAGCASPLNTQQTWRVPGTLAPDGPLTSGVSGKCADDSSSSTTAGNKIDSWTCNSSAAQNWTIADNGELQVLGNCATIAGTASASLVELEPCTGAATQKWAAGPGGAWTEATDAGTAQLCLSDPSNSTTNGTQLEIITCAGDTGQEWAPAATTVPATVTGVTVTAGAGSATVTWTPPVSAGGKTITGYVVTSSSGQKADAGPYDTTATVTGLTPGTSCTFTVTAQTGLGASVSAPTTAITPGNETSYTYDAAGNLTSSQTDGITTTNSYNADEELTKSVTGTTTVSYAYDADGNQTTARSTSYAYNAANEMTNAGTAAGNFTYGYDSNGDLATISLNGAGLSATIWDLNNPLPEVAEDTTSSGSVSSDYNWNPDSTLNSQTEDGTTYYAATDWEGSLTGLISTSGTQESNTSYTAYGTPSTTGTITTSIGYTGSYRLTGSGLDNMHARDYNPATGQFTTVDPLLYVTGEPYEYADDNPVQYVDLSGLCWAGLSWACEAGGWIGQNAGQIGTVVGFVGLSVAAYTVIATCVVCDTIGLAADVIGTALNSYSTYQDWGTCNSEALTFDLIGDFLGSVGFIGDFGGWLTAAGEGEHAAESEAHFAWALAGASSGTAGTIFSGIGWYINSRYPYPFSSNGG